MKKETLQAANELQNKIDTLRESNEIIISCANPAGCFIHIPNDTFLQQAVAKVIWDRIAQLEQDLENL